jgi:hypothetical protein
MPPMGERGEVPDAIDFLAATSWRMAAAASILRDDFFSIRS